MSDEQTHSILLGGKFPPIKKMSKAELLSETEMWRNIWGWIPSQIKYYIARTGSTVGITIRNYTRYLGVLLDTEWELKGVECGVFEKVYDQNDGNYYFERKIIKLPLGQIVSFQWIQERILDEIMAKEDEESISEDGKVSLS